MDEDYLLLLQGDRKTKPTLIYEDSKCAILECDNETILWIRGEWEPSVRRLALEYDVQHIEADHSLGWTGKSIAFLDELPRVRSVFISTHYELDWRPLEEHPYLESITAFSISEKQNVLNFTKVKRLRRCRLWWIPEFDSIRHCAQLEALVIGSSEELLELNIEHLVSLKELRISHCSQLSQLNLAEKASLRSFQLSFCPKLAVDLRRIVRDLEELCLEGSQNYPLDDLKLATQLTLLQMAFVDAKKGVPAFLDKLPNLRHARAVGTELKESDQKIVRSFSIDGF